VLLLLLLLLLLCSAVCCCSCSCPPQVLKVNNYGMEEGGQSAWQETTGEW
jgi:hypothetical protein